VDLGRALAPHVDVRLFGPNCPQDLPGTNLPSVPRRVFEDLGQDPSRAYYLEQATFAPGLLAGVLAFQPDILHLSDPALTNAMTRALHWLPGRTHLVFCNGGAIGAEHYRRYEHTQLVH